MNARWARPPCAHKPDVKGAEGPELGCAVGCNVNDIPHERLQVSGRVPEVRGNTSSKHPQLTSCVYLVPGCHFVGKLFFLSLRFLSVAVVSGGYPTRVVFLELAKDYVPLATRSAQAAATSREEEVVADISVKCSSSRAWTRANSASMCRAHVVKSSAGKAPTTAGAPEKDPDPTRAAAARARRVAPASALAAAAPRHQANHPLSK